MDQQMLEQHLAQAERHVVEGEKHITRQREIVAELERSGLDTLEAITLLKQFEDMQELHIADRDRLREELRSADRT